MRRRNNQNKHRGTLINNNNPQFMSLYSPCNITPQIFNRWNSVISHIESTIVKLVNPLLSIDDIRVRGIKSIQATTIVNQLIQSEDVFKRSIYTNLNSDSSLTDELFNELCSVFIQYPQDNACHRTVAQYLHIFHSRTNCQIPFGIVIPVERSTKIHLLTILLDKVIGNFNTMITADEDDDNPFNLRDRYNNRNSSNSINRYRLFMVTLFMAHLTRMIHQNTHIDDGEDSEDYNLRVLNLYVPKGGGQWNQLEYESYDGYNSEWFDGDPMEDVRNTPSVQLRFN